MAMRPSCHPTNRVETLKGNQHTAANHQMSSFTDPERKHGMPHWGSVPLCVRISAKCHEILLH